MRCWNLEKLTGESCLWSPKHKIARGLKLAMRVRDVTSVTEALITDDIMRPEHPTEGSVCCADGSAKDDMAVATASVRGPSVTRRVMLFSSW